MGSLPPEGRGPEPGVRVRLALSGDISGEQFYPEGVRWDDPIARGTLPDLLSAAAAEFGARPAIEFRDRPISYSELEALVETAASAFLRAGYGKNSSVALFLGNSPDHPVNFFGALKAGARVVHLSPLDGEIALSHKLTDSGARVLVTSNLSALLPTALKFLDKGLLDRLIVCEDDHWGKAGTPQTALPDNPQIVTYRQFIDGAAKPSQWPAISADDVALLQYTGGTTGLAERRDAQPRQSDLGGVGLRRLGQAGARSNAMRSSA